MSNKGYGIIMKIKSLHLENYRCFAKLDMQFDKALTAIVGINGSGKTAILDALGIFLKMYAGNFASYADRNNFPASLLKHGTESAILSCNFDDETRNDNPQFEITMKFSKKSAGSSLSVHSGDAAILRLRNVAENEKDPFATAVYYSSKRILNSIKKNDSAKSELKSAFTNAFSPQIDFSSSLAWFIERATQEALEAVQKKDMKHTLSDLSAVRTAVSKALGDYGEPFIGETPPALFIPQRNDPDKTFRIEELSDGYRTMLALVMDLARRMAVANQHITWTDGKTVLHSPGVVLIDEVELHLHPSWQQTVLPTLMDIFPNVQFIVTTHSPQVLTSIAAKHIRILKDGEVLSLPEETEGAEASRVLEDVLGVSSRPQGNPFAQKLNLYTKLVYDEKWDSPEAEKLRAALGEHYGDSEPKLKELDLHIENSKWERGL